VRIEIKLERNQPIQLPALLVLEATKDFVHGLPEEGLRHPLGTYNVSVETVISAATQVMNELENLLPLVGESTAERALNAASLRHATRHFILANGDHIDACEKILKCYFAVGKNGKYAKAKRELRSNLSWYERHIMSQANHLKHRHSQVKSLCLYTDKLAAPGYFIESLINSDTVGPDPIVHGKNNTAFSYIRQLRLFICGLFYISRTLSSILSNGKSFNTCKTVGNLELTYLIERIASYPDFMFPDEYAQAYPDIRCTQNYFLISYNENKSRVVPYGLVHFKAMLGGDGVSRSFQVPYLKRQ
jgi:hypothetical protein